MSEAAASAFMQAIRGSHPHSLAPQTPNIEISLDKSDNKVDLLKYDLKKNHLRLSSRKMSF